MKKAFLLGVFLLFSLTVSSQVSFTVQSKIQKDSTLKSKAAQWSQNVDEHDTRFPLKNLIQWQWQLMLSIVPDVLKTKEASMLLTVVSLYWSTS